MPYWRMFYHFVWSTKNRLPLITADIEASIYRLLSSACGKWDGQVFAINGMPDHVHLVTTIPPVLAVSDFIQKVKGGSSYAISAEFDRTFYWQRGYGVFTLTHDALERTIAYVANQKIHHAKNTLIQDFEQSSQDENGPVSFAPYQ